MSMRQTRLEVKEFGAEETHQPGILILPRRPMVGKMVAKATFNSKTDIYHWQEEASTEQ
jgi:hypothetical protein